ncbi:uncharacterized protein LY79DRAFT_3679 [Colletotrichum navitas]|uniref:Uncharacterized protein n=1 Tax=Colletotrichum navitas TaxID=681940 RepID=A0AAD8QCB9_9PEZI|nr:uncharacterized protein LY79DRAFT_3679 [Colletotrichum navitas]KAK1600000.1 hypothetical protein LY79DRAFT_3679 [Colletotrichum navitas]
MGSGSLLCVAISVFPLEPTLCYSCWARPAPSGWQSSFITLLLATFCHWWSNLVMVAWICPTRSFLLRLSYKRMHLDGSLARQVPACCSENSGLRPHESPKISRMPIPCHAMHIKNALIYLHMRLSGASTSSNT